MVKSSNQDNFTLTIAIDDNVFCMNKLLYLPKAAFKTKNSTKRRGAVRRRLVEFLVFNSIH